MPVEARIADIDLAALTAGRTYQRVMWTLASAVVLSAIRAALTIKTIHAKLARR
ncbi:hypothetical protein [Rhizobium sp. BT-226]|uniref:hypothetical protein n=1 Tax=Rhizobium sp. BT-226 TaxID=2986922 RepID=UPI0021F77ABF|nr:hypothetical protein [Rhizobium sp. BT-226]MCW0018967.1 hypothetical protein [Rhizobium sp. BT-226]